MLDTFRNLPSKDLKIDNFRNDHFVISEKLLIKDYENLIHAIINEIYTNFSNEYNDYQYIRERAIVTPINEVVDIINRQIGC